MKIYEVYGMVFLHSLADVLTLLWYDGLPATELGNTRQYNTYYGWRQYLVADGAVLDRSSMP